MSGVGALNFLFFVCFFLVMVNILRVATHLVAFVARELLYGVLCFEFHFRCALVLETWWGFPREVAASVPS